jgi:hypothetical protein
MPYSGERASKTAHQGIVENPTVTAFQAECEYLREPSEEEAESIVSSFHEVAVDDSVSLPARVIAIDGSWYEGSVNDRLLPSTRLGYVQIGGVLVDLAHLSRLRVKGGRFVDPFAVSALDEHNGRLIFTVPSSNVTYKGQPSVRAGFRLAVDEHFASEATWTRPGDPTSSLRATLFVLTARRRGELATGDVARLLLARCPNAGCDARGVPVSAAPGPQKCPECGGPVYATDVLRIWENVTDHQPNLEALGRLGSAVEQLLAIHYIRTLAEGGSLETLAGTAFFLDGPLALFGNMAWIHGPILDFVLDLNRSLAGAGHDPILMLGLQKTGQLVDYGRVIAPYLDNSRLLCVDDAFRYRFISPRDEAAVTFGLETHYGQDFLYKTKTGRMFVFALPYPKHKDPRADFVIAKSDESLYPTIPRAIRLINEFETALYENATIPIVLAHRYTAISLVPGGRVLDVLSRQGIGSH